MTPVPGDIPDAETRRIVQAQLALSLRVLPELHAQAVALVEPSEEASDGTGAELRLSRFR
jgi:hypothetical protein